MAVPKKKISKSRRDMRRSHHALRPPNTGECSNCRTVRASHRLAPTLLCGKNLCIIRAGPWAKAHGSDCVLPREGAIRTVRASHHRGPSTYLSMGSGPEAATELLLPQQTLRPPGPRHSFHV